MRYLLVLGLFIVSAFAQPSWVDSPTNSSFIGGVGIVKNKTLRRIAVIKARAELLESIKVDLNTSTKLTKSSSQNHYSNEYSQQISQKAKGILIHSFVKDSFIDKDGYYYIWVVVKKQTLK